MSSCPQVPIQYSDKNETPERQGKLSGGLPESFVQQVQVETSSTTFHIFGHIFRPTQLRPFCVIPNIIHLKV